MRGKDAWYMGGCVSARITPAYAGKRTAILFASPKRQDHPRLCGEKAASVLPVIATTGSPPPMRGKD